MIGWEWFTTSWLCALARCRAVPLRLSVHDKRPIGARPAALLRSQDRLTLWSMAGDRLAPCSNHCRRACLSTGAGSIECSRMVCNRERHLAPLVLSVKFIGVCRADKLRSLMQITNVTNCYTCPYRCPDRCAYQRSPIGRKARICLLFR